MPTQYYTDSRDVLAWITNDSTKEVLKRYVTSRIDTIRKISNPNQWYYIPTTDNPADIGTRPISVKNLEASNWLKGPPFLSSNNPQLLPKKQPKHPLFTNHQQPRSRITSSRNIVTARKTSPQELCGIRTSSLVKKKMIS